MNHLGLMVLTMLAEVWPCGPSVTDCDKQYSVPPHQQGMAMHTIGSLSNILDRAMRAHTIASAPSL